MKKIISILIALVMVVGTVPVGTFAAELPEVQNINYVGAFSTVSWKAVDGVGRYVFKAFYADTDVELYASHFRVNNFNFANEGLPSGNYYVTVQAFNASGSPITKETKSTVFNYTAEKISVKVKAVNVPSNGKVAVELLGEDGIPLQGVNMTAESGWAHTFENLDEYATGTTDRIEYTIKVDNVSPTGYGYNISGDAFSGFVITLYEETPAHTHGDGTTFDKWTATSGDLTAGNYYLAESNATALTDDIIIPEGATVTLCLNGKTLDIGSNYIDVKDGAEFNICDCQSASGKITGTHSYQTIFNRGSGSVTVLGGTVADTNGGGIRNYSTGSVTVKGGTVTGTTYGIKIENNGTVYLSGNPTVSGNDTDYADLYLESGNIYAEDGDGTSYTGDALTVKLETPAIGDVVVNNVTDGNMDKFSVTISDRYLDLSGDDLILTDKPPHKHDGKIFTEWTATSGTVASGNYYLSGNVTATGSITVSSGTVNLCLNGHTLDMGSNRITVSSGATLNICDCSEGETGVIKSTHRAALDSNDKYSDTAGAINVFGNVTISSGTVQNDCQYGRAIYVGSNANLTVSGGKVAITNSGHYAVFVGNNTLFGTDPAGTFTMTGGVIDTGTGYNNGTGVYIHNGAVATVTGGKISSENRCIDNIDSTLIIGGDAVINYTGKYCAIWVNANGSSATAVLHISGGTITAPNAKAAVSIASGNGDTVAYLSGNPTITGKDSDISIPVEQDGTIKPKLYAVSEDGNTAYSGEALRLYLNGANRAQSGEVVVRNSTDTEKFTLANGGYKLEQSGENLAIATYGYSLWVGGVYVTEDNASDILGNGTASYNAETQTLYLENAVISGSYTPEDLDFAAGIYSSHALNIVISGTVNIHVENSNYGMGILVDGDLNIAKDPDSSSVTLNVIGDFAAAGCLDGGNITYDGLTVKGSVEIDTQNAPTEEVALSDGTFFVGSDIAKMLQFTYTVPHPHGETVYTAWTATSGTVTSGHYYLTESNTTLYTSDIYIESDADVTLCLNGFTLDLGSRCFYLRSGSTLTICDCGEGGNITSEYSVIDNNGGTFVLQSGAVVSTEGNCIANDAGDIIISGGTVNSYFFSGIHSTSDGVITVSGGEIISSDYDGIIIDNSNGTANITGGTIQGYNCGIFNYGGELTVSGGTVIGNTSRGIDNRGTLTVSGNAVISGVTGVFNYDATSSILGGSITGTQLGISNSEGTLNVSGGNISATDTNSCGIATNGTVHLYGTPVITGNESSYADIYISGGEFCAQSSDGTAAYTGDALTVMVYNQAVGDVIISNASADQFTLVQKDGYTLKQDGTNLVLAEAPKHTHGETAYTELTDWAQLATSGNYYLGDTIPAVSGNITIASGVEITLCLNGKTLDLGSRYINNKGNITICDCQEEQGTITSTSYGIYNAANGTVAISGGTVSSKDDNAVYNYGKGSVVISGGTVKSENSSAIYNYNSGSITVSGGTVSGNKYGILNNSTAHVVISNTAVVLGNEIGIYNAGGTITVSGGTVKATQYGIMNYLGTVEISGGAVSSESFIGVYNESTGSVTVSGGTVTGNIAVYNYSEGSAEISGGLVAGSEYGVFNSGTGTIYLSGSPSISGGAEYCELSNRNGKIYAQSSDGNTVYAGGVLRIKVNSPADGKVAVYSSTDTSKFSLVNTDGYILVAENGNLILGVPHTHSWATDWTTSETHHWHECENVNCTVTENSEKNGYAEHSYVNGNCECGLHTHSWATDWTTNETHHWHECENANCTVSENSEKNGYAEHSYVNGNCECGLHTHKWSTDWTTNETHHWHECENANCTVSENAEKNGYAEHTYVNGNCECGLHTHSWATAWTTNETHHWHECENANCTVSENSDKNGYAEHTYVNGNCECGLHTHSWATDWATNETHHWHECENANCTVSENSEKNGYAEHSYVNGNCECGLHSHDGGATVFEMLTATSGALASGNYYLAGNVTATGQITVANGETVTLCLNGNTLDLGSYNISNRGTLTICDCQTAEGTISSKNSDDGIIYNIGTLTINAGNVIYTGSGEYVYSIYNAGGQTTVNGGHIDGTIENYATFILEGGSITNSGKDSAIDNSDGVTIVNGGSIENDGLCVFNYCGMLYVSGGSITSTESAAISNYDGYTYIYGTPVLSGDEENYADIVQHYSDYALVYAQSKDGVTAYTGEVLTVAFDDDESYEVGNIAIAGVNSATASKFILVGNDKYLLKQGTGDNADKLLVALSHEHSWQYSANGATVTATCVGEGTCEYAADNKQITVLAPGVKYYTDNGEFAATLSADSLAGQEQLPTIYYVGRANTQYEESTIAPTNPGAYTAYITVGSATAKVDYMLERKVNKEVNGYIYINEHYHALMVGNRFLLMPHNDKGTGYCETCQAEIIATVE